MFDTDTDTDTDTEQFVCLEDLTGECALDIFGECPFMEEMGRCFCINPNGD